MATEPADTGDNGGEGSRHDGGPMSETPKKIAVLVTPDELAFLAVKAGITVDEVREAWRVGFMRHQVVEAQPVPRRWHRCRMVFGDGDFSKPRDHVEWCACGGIRRNGGRWTQRNTRKRQR